MMQPHLLAQLQAAFAAVRRGNQLLLIALQIDLLHQRIFPLRTGIQPQLHAGQRFIFAEVMLAVANTGCVEINSASPAFAWT